MFWSRYSRLLKSERFGHLLYSCETGSLAEIDEETYRELLKIKDNIGTYDFTDAPELYQQLTEARIIVPDNDAGYRSFKLRSLLRRFDTSSLLLTVAPTRDCNFACDYCFERERPPVYMSDETEDHLIDFIKSYSDINTGGSLDDITGRDWTLRGVSLTDRRERVGGRGRCSPGLRPGGGTEGAGVSP